MLVDDVTITVKAGHGGPGKVAFSKIPKMLGPTGGNGGHGGNVFIEGVSDLTALKRFRFQKSFAAQNGAPGGTKNQEGKAGESITLTVPVGTIVRLMKDLAPGERADSNEARNFQTIEILEIGKPVMVARGGQGGKGNFLFRSSINTSPQESQPGLPGQEFSLQLELKLIADIGLIGLPNAGKSSLLNVLTRATVKVANYPFTTLEPNLGVYYPTAVLRASDVEQQKAKPIILADIPGLIEGASSGKGLGVKFLRHISRTQYLVHCLSCESDDLKKDYQVIRAELKQHDPELLHKKECIALTKTDLRSLAEIKKQLTILKKLNPAIITVSVTAPGGLDALKTFLDSGVVGN